MKRLLLWAVIPPAALYFLAFVAPAEEPTEDFLAELRAKGYHDVALDYLDQVEREGLAPPAFRERVLYEKGLSLVDLSRTQRDPALRVKSLNEAEATFKEFISRHGTHPMVASANNQLGNLIVERARMKLEDADRDTANKTKIRDEARQLYQQAYDVFQTSQEEVKGALEKLPKGVLNPKDKNDAKIIDRRDQLRADYLQVQLLSAAIREEMADTYDAKSMRYGEILMEAAKQYEKIYEKYRTRLAGLYARLYQGRCYLKIKNYKEALSYFADLLEQPDEHPALRELKKKTLLLAVQAWLDPAQNKYVEAINQLQPVIQSLRPEENRDLDWIELKLWLARAYVAAYEDLADKKPRPPEYATSRTNARNFAESVSRIPSAHQEAARELLAKIGGFEYKAEDGPPETFSAAKSAGRDALDAMTIAQQALATLPAQIAKEKDADKKKELEQKKADATTALQEGPDKAMEMFKLALRLSNDDTPISEINVVQYFLTYLYYLQERYFEAGALGEFVARKFPTSAGARQCAKIALASYLQLYGAGKDEEADRAFETERIVGICEYTIDTWSDEPEAVDAANTLIAFKLKAEDYQAAQTYLALLPENNPRRGESEVKVGLAIWTAYLNGAKQLNEWKKAETPPEGVDLAAEEQRLAKLKADAEGTLKSGVERAKQNNKAGESASALLSLAQIYVEGGEPEKIREAIDLLENPTYGVLTLVKNDDPSVRRPGFAAEAYKVALQAYMTSLGEPDVDSEKTIESAKAAMEGLKSSVAVDADGQQALVGTLMSLAGSLKKQMDAADQAKKERLSEGYNVFLGQVSAESSDLNTLLWVAQTFLDTAKSLDDDPLADVDPTAEGRHEVFLKAPQAEVEEPAPNAKRVYEKAVDAYDVVLIRGAIAADGSASDQAVADKLSAQGAEVDAARVAEVRETLQGQTLPGDWLPANMQNHAMLQLAGTQRRLGNYKAAVNLMTDILLRSNSMLNVQVEAAYTYELWAVKGQESLYGLAMAGTSNRKDERKEIDGKPNKNYNKPIIWGWGKLAFITARYEQYSNIFFASRYHLALCRYQYAVRLADSDAAKSKETFEQAKEDILATDRLFPYYGGAEGAVNETRRQDFDDLLKLVQERLREPAGGLPPIEKAEAAGG